jgi:hypothetical protein
MTRYFWQSTERFILLLSTFGVLLLGLTWESRSAHAALEDSPVIIAVDATNQQGPCTETFIANIHTPLQSITNIPCPAGTIITSAIVQRSQAIAQHTAYVVLPSKGASPVVWQQTYRQLQKLLQTSKKASVHPLTRCGNSGSASVNWYPFGIHYFSTEQFYKTSDCRYVNLELASIRSYSTQYFLMWAYDLYAGGNFGVPGCPALVDLRTYSHGVDQLWAPGYYYENWLYRSCVYGSSWYNNIGPIN